MSMVHAMAAVVAVYAIVGFKDNNETLICRAQEGSNHRAFDQGRLSVRFLFFFSIYKDILHFFYLHTFLVIDIIQ